MNKIDLESAEKLAKTLLHKNMSEIFATAETNPDLVGEWLRELSAALRFHQGISDQLLEAIEDVRTALATHVPNGTTSYRSPRYSRHAPSAKRS